VKLILVDDVLAMSSPSAVSFVLAIPTLAERGWVVEAWCNKIDKDLEPYVTHRWIPCVRLPVVGVIINWFLRNTWWGIRWLFTRSKRETVFYALGGRFVFSDLNYYHFYNQVWYRIQKGGVEDGYESPLRRYMQLWGLFEGWVGMRSPFGKLRLTVSRAIREDLIADFPTARVEILPNAIDLTRFDRSASSENRAALREEFQFGDDETVLLFVSQGHHTRKGFWLALKCLNELRSRGERKFRFVVLGGRPKKLSRIEAYMDDVYPDWREWVDLVGQTTRVPEYMAASDALFFPSYFEAFSLVEIEAAAMGLPLLLTKHHGSEMIVKEGVNGFRFSFDEEEIMEVLLRFREEGLEITEPYLGEALSVAEWSDQFAQHIAELFEAKAGTSASPKK